jgi:hypothetical protein
MMTTIEAVAELRKEFARRGWDKKATNRIVFELSIHCLCWRVFVVSRRAGKLGAANRSASATCSAAHLHSASGGGSSLRADSSCHAARL